jgi:hypothetical protein
MLGRMLVELALSAMWDGTWLKSIIVWDHHVFYHIYKVTLCRVVSDIFTIRNQKGWIEIHSKVYCQYQYERINPECTIIVRLERDYGVFPIFASADIRTRRCTSTP